MPNTATAPTLAELSARVKQIFHDAGCPAATPQPGTDRRFLTGGTYVIPDPKQPGALLVEYKPPFPNSAARAVARVAVQRYSELLTGAGITVAWFVADDGVPFLQVTG